MTHKIKKLKEKKSKLDIAAIIVGVFSLLILSIICVFLIILILNIKDVEEISMSDFETSQSTIIYDQNGNVISELGSTIRTNVDYEDLPNTLIDAIVAAEDSRYFEHNGLDIPRYVVSSLNNLLGTNKQSNSTITMQLIESTYTTEDNSFQNNIKTITNAIDLESNTNKKQILTLLLNKLYYGGSRNIRGIQKASEYYFSKNVSELNLSESALLVGILNDPDLYNPLTNLSKATERRNEVLYQMYNHGYIDKIEYDLALNIKVENLLKNQSTAISESIGIPYQAYIDVVIDEVYELTGYDPFVTPMKIYTYIDTDLQALLDDIQAGINDTITYFDDDIEIGGVVLNNRNNTIVGVIGGRNYTSGNYLLTSHATDNLVQPGATIQSILDYALAFEELGWSTSHVLCDQPINYSGTNNVITNSNNAYVGDIELKEALGNNLNTPAIQALQEVINKYGNSNVVSYLQSIGIDITLDEFDIKCGLGTSNLKLTVKELADAFATLINSGSYCEGHTISRVEFLNGRAPISTAYVATQTIISEETAYQITSLLKNNVDSNYSTGYELISDDYPIYATIANSYYDETNITSSVRNGTAKDSWAIGSTVNYTCAIWTGYDKDSYIKTSDLNKNLSAQALNLILDKTVELYNQPEEIEKPETVTSITHIIGTYPYAEIIEDMPEEYITTGYIKVKDINLVKADEQSIEVMIDDPEVTIDEANSKLKIVWPVYPDETKLSIASERKDISLDLGLKRIEASGRRIFDYSWIYGAIRYKADIYINGVLSQAIISDVNETEIEIEIEPGSSILVNVYYGYEYYDINSTPVAITLGVQDMEISYTIPSSIDDLSELEMYGISVKYETVKTTDSSKQNTYVITDNQGRIMDDDGVVYSFNSIHTASQTELLALELTCTHYTAPSASINISSTEIDENNQITLTAIVSNSDEKQIDWTLPNNVTLISEELLTNGETIVIEVHESVTIKAKIHGTDVSKEFYISIE